LVDLLAGELQGSKELAAAAFNARVIPSVAYADPEVDSVGLTEDPAKAQSPKPKAQSPKPKAQSPKPKAQSPKPKAQGIKVKKGQFP
jgi:pyruvate/2-oxoglutarate dehydrogenase complex dihydrolipoamide dehydrogenase (E3) component